MKIWLSKPTPPCLKSADPLVHLASPLPHLTPQNASMWLPRPTRSLACVCGSSYTSSCALDEHRRARGHFSARCRRGWRRPWRRLTLQTLAVTDVSQRASRVRDSGCLAGAHGGAGAQSAGVQMPESCVRAGAAWPDVSRLWVACVSTRRATCVKAESVRCVVASRFSKRSSSNRASGICSSYYQDSGRDSLCSMTISAF
jgi:hypothetical protein